MASNDQKLLITGGQVYEHDGDVHHPRHLDVLIQGSEIMAVGSPLPEDQIRGAEILDARNHLIIPGLINAHYHSHDTLCRGLFEELPLEMWLLYTLPMGAYRSTEEIRLRTLVGALESLRCGITTVQDMLGLVPLNETMLDVVIAAYREIGERVVFSPMVSDRPPVDMLCFKDTLPPDVQEMLGTVALDARIQIDFLETQIRRHPASDILHWAVGPFAPQRCSPDLLGGCGDLAERHNLGLYIHVYETRNQIVMARQEFGQHGGSFITYLDDCGILNRRLNIAHSVWLAREEMDRMAEADAGAVLNHLSNMKLKSGVAPILDMREAGMRVALGCDNCSGTDVQNMFQAMKMYCLLAAVSDPEPGPPLSAEALRAATLGSARTAMLDSQLGAVKPGYKADLVLIDLKDPAWLPFNSASRQLVYTESGRSVSNVIINGQVVLRDRVVQTIDEAALREEVNGLMKHFIADFEEISTTREKALPYMRNIHRQVWGTDVAMNRFLARTGYEEGST